MGGKILDLPEFKIYDQGKADGITEGITRGNAEGEKERKVLAQECKELTQENAQLKSRIEELEKMLSNPDSPMSTLQ